MRILDENDKEVKEEDVDTSLGYLTQDRIIKEHVPAKAEVPEVYHYEVDTWYFTDGTSTPVGGNDDPTVKVIDDKSGVFEYVDDGSGKQYKGADIRRVTDSKREEAVPEHDEYEDIQRYTLYSKEEVQERKEAKEKSEKREEFLTNGPDQLSDNTTNINDLTIMLSELVGTSDAEV